MTALDAVRQLQDEHTALQEAYDRTPVEKRVLVEENLRLRAFARDIAFLAKNYDTPEISLACRNHVELVEHMNEALELLGLDFS